MRTHHQRTKETQARRNVKWKMKQASSTSPRICILYSIHAYGCHCSFFCKLLDLKMINFFGSLTIIFGRYLKFKFTAISFIHFWKIMIYFCSFLSLLFVIRNRNELNYSSYQYIYSGSFLHMSSVFCSVPLSHTFLIDTFFCTCRRQIEGTRLIVDNKKCRNCASKRIHIISRPIPFKDSIYN